MVVVFWMFTPCSVVFDVSEQHAASIFRVNQFHWRYTFLRNVETNKRTLHDAETQKTALSFHMV